MDYSEILNYFININNIKLGEVARLLNYDISYISKWLNAKRRPSKKYILDINKKLSKMFAKKILKNNLILKCSQDLNLTLDTNKNEDLFKIELENIIYKNLNLAFEGKLEIIKKETKSDISFIMGSIEIRNTLVKIFRDIFTNTENNIEIWWTINILSDFSEFLFKLISKYKKSEQIINIHCTYNRKFINNDAKSIFRIINKYNYINFEIYEDNKFEDFNFISIDNSFFANISRNESSLFTMTYGYDKNISHSFLNMIKEELLSSKKIIEMKDDLRLSSKNFLTSFYTRDKFSVLLNYGFEYLIPEDILREVILNSQLDDYNQKFLIEVNEVLKDFFEKSFVNLIIPENILLNYLKKGNFYFYTYKFNLNENHIGKHIENIISVMKSNPQFNIYIISDDIFKNYNYNTFNIYSNSEYIYFKKFIKISSGFSYNSSIVNNKIFNNIIARDLQAIINNRSTKKLTYYDLRKLYKLVVNKK